MVGRVVAGINTLLCLLSIIVNVRVSVVALDYAECQRLSEREQLVTQSSSVQLVYAYKVRE